jgi:hypothetical protein
MARHGILPRVIAGPASAPERDEAYTSLEAPDALPILSLLLFTAALAARPLARLVPPELRPYPWGVLLPVAIGLGSSALGLLLATFALRRARRRGFTQLALLLNGIVLALNSLAAAGMVWILRR